LRGCQSVVHFAAERDGDEIRFHAGSDAAIVQGPDRLADSCLFAAHGR
jgi:sulfur transfer protein SufE